MVQNVILQLTTITIYVNKVYKMRYKFKKPVYPEDSEIRVIKRFAYLPVKIGREIRWLEKVVIEQEYFASASFFDVAGPHWHNKRFIDEPEITEIN